MTTRYKPAQISDDRHEWLRTEAFLRRTSITAELAEAVDLLREIRATNGSTANPAAAQAVDDAVAVAQ